MTPAAALVLFQQQTSKHSARYTQHIHQSTTRSHFLLKISKRAAAAALTRRQSRRPFKYTFPWRIADRNIPAAHLRLKVPRISNPFVSSSFCRRLQRLRTCPLPCSGPQLPPTPPNSPQLPPTLTHASEPFSVIVKTEVSPNLRSKLQRLPVRCLSTRAHARPRPLFPPYSPQAALKFSLPTFKPSPHSFHRHHHRVLPRPHPRPPRRPNLLQLPAKNGRCLALSFPHLKQTCLPIHTPTTTINCRQTIHVPTLQRPPPPTRCARLPCLRPLRPPLQCIRARSDGAARARCKCAWRSCDVVLLPVGAVGLGATGIAVAFC